MPYAKSRILTITVVAAVMAAVALLVGFPRAALGVAAGWPVGIFNHYLMVRAARKVEGDSPARAQLGLFKWSLARMGISVAALLASVPMGPEFIIGVLVGLTSEMFTQLGDVARMIARSRR